MKIVITIKDKKSSKPKPKKTFGSAIIKKLSKFFEDHQTTNFNEQPKKL